MSKYLDIVAILICIFGWLNEVQGRHVTALVLFLIGFTLCFILVLRRIIYEFRNSRS